MSLEIFAMNFLRFEKRCPVALFERSPRPGIGEPDVLGITRDRHLLEIEIKRSYSDFRANEKKAHLSIRFKSQFQLEAERFAPRWPKQFWYLVPPELVKKVEPWTPDWAGLMRGPVENEPQGAYVVKKAPVNKASLRLTVREMLELGHCMANQILCQAHHIATLQNRFVSEGYDWDFCPII